MATARDRTPRRWSSHERQDLPPLRLVRARSRSKQLSGVRDGACSRRSRARTRHRCHSADPDPDAGVRPDVHAPRKRSPSARPSAGVRELDRADGSPPASSPSSAAGAFVFITAHTGRHAGDVHRFGVGAERDLDLRGAGSAGVGAVDVGSADGSGRSRAPGRAADQPGRRLERRLPAGSA